ncbi:MAG: exodeoxyribonuclease VII large subunit [Chitinispirillaceae bacterium]|jgi:exodeoxyribonuclease VII large subunit
MSGPAFQFLAPTQAERPYTVSEINEGIALVLESGNSLVWVEGEISNWRVSGNGHCYFRLKDAESQIPAVLWRNLAEKLPFSPEDGLSVSAIASIRVFRKAGYYQLDVHRLEPRGKGALFIAFEQLKKKLENEGLFDPAHKRPLPPSIRRIGVVTSKQGAAIRDIVRVVASRAPQTGIVLADVPVQGETAAQKIASAIRAFNAYGKVDCIIAGRGGGTTEDLWPFNEEIVARAIYDSEIAVISAVGHEIDFTIADFVADLRAPTPSAAAEMAAPDRAESQRYFDACAVRFSGAVSRYFTGIYERFESSASHRSLRMALQLIPERQQELDSHMEALNRRVIELLQTFSLRFSTTASRLHALSPLAVLSRGYSVITTVDGQSVRDADRLTPGQDVSMRFHRGSATAKVETISPPS